MGEEVEDALARFGEGFNCCQAVLSAWAGRYGLDREKALRLASAFGGGMAGLGEVCGAVTGALMVIGLDRGQTAPKDKETKERNYLKVRDFAGRFRTLHGTLLCRELLGVDLTTAEGMEAARARGLFTERCPCFVRDATAILREIL